MNRYIPIWYGSLPQQVTYDAEIISTDNFYNEQTQSYEGEQQSVTSYNYHIVDETPNAYIVENTFDVRTIEGKIIIALSRKYGVDKKTGKHIMSLGDKPREGYLFAPKNLHEGEAYTYWHINYEAPAKLSFLKKEEIQGLPVFVYRTHYEGYTIEQTDDLTYLPGVPESRQIILEPELTVWVEPITGTVIAYEDNTTAYYYDRQSGKKLYPWNHFHNKYTKASINKHVNIAKKRLFFLITCTKVIPVVLIIVALLILMPIKRKNIKILFGLIAIILMGVYIVSIYYISDKKDPVIIGIARWVDNVNQNKNIENFKQGIINSDLVEGKDVLFLEEPSSDADSAQHRKTIQSYLNQHADMIYSLTTPGTLIVQEEVKGNIPIIFSVVIYPEESGVVKSLTNSGNNTVGTRNWVSGDTQMNFFLEIFPNMTSMVFVQRTNESNSNIQFEEFSSVGARKHIAITQLQAKDKQELQTVVNNTDFSIFDALYLACDTLIQGQSANEIIIKKAKEQHVPVFSCAKTGVEKGALAGVIPNVEKLGTIFAKQAIQIINGVNPTTLATIGNPFPVQLINVNTFHELHIDIPQTVELESITL